VKTGTLLYQTTRPSTLLLNSVFILGVYRGNIPQSFTFPPKSSIFVFRPKIFRCELFFSVYFMYVQYVLKLQLTSLRYYFVVNKLTSNRTHS